VNSRPSIDRARSGDAESPDYFLEGTTN